jgi:broad specificity phosphatase PhoE
MLRILIARHGQTAYNREFRNQGHADIELDDVGVGQAACLRAALAGEQFDAIYTSQLKRATATANAVANGAQVLIDSRLAERDYGDWEGKTKDEIAETDPDRFVLYRSDPVVHTSGGGETGIDVFMRGVAFLCDLFATHSKGAVLVVTHGGSGSALIAALLHGSPATADCFRLSNCSVTEFLIDGGKRRMVRFDDHSHLADAPLRYPHAGFTAR